MPRYIIVDCTPLVFKDSGGIVKVPQDPKLYLLLDSSTNPFTVIAGPSSQFGELVALKNKLEAEPKVQAPKPKGPFDR